MRKEELRELRHMDCLINSKLRQIDDLRSKMKYLQAIDYAKDKIQTSNKASVEDTIIKLCDLEAEITQEIDELIDKKRVAKEEIDKIEDATLRSILTMRYIEMLKWEEIAVQLNYDYRHVLRLHGEALNKLSLNVT